MNSNITDIRNAIIDGDNQETVARVTAALEAGADPGEVLEGGMINAMNEVGRLYETGEVFVPEMLLSGRAMKAGLAILKPYLVKSDHKPKGTVVIGTVKGDLHDIGKNLVGMMLEGAGFEVVDLGVDVAPESFVACVKETSPDILALSALLSTTMPNMKATIAGLSEAGLRDQVKVIIGGAPVTNTYADQIGADGYSTNAAGSIAVATRLILEE